jgi:hypothetical protein
LLSAPLVATGEPAVLDKDESRFCKERMEPYSAISTLGFNLIPGPMVVDNATVRI